MSLEMALLMLPGLVIGLTVHEFAHAWSASLLGDGFARRQGRVSLNPLRHLSPLGTLAIFLLPFGWGRPVPVNLYNFKRPRRDYLLTSLAGPAANVLVVAACLGLMLLTRHTYRFEPPYDGWVEMAHGMLAAVTVINVLLATFNLIPIPPLDGSKIWPCLLPGLKPAAGGRTTWIFVLVLLGLLWTDSLQPVIRFSVDNVGRLMPVSEGRLFRRHWAAADNALAERRWADAEEEFGRALDINPRSPGCLIGRAGARVKRARWAEALEDVDRAIEIRPEATTYAYRAAILRALGRNEEARVDEGIAKAMEAAEK